MMTHRDRLEVRRIATRSLFRQLLIGMYCTVSPLLLLAGILRIFGIEIPRVDFRLATGWPGFCQAILYAFVAPIVGACSAWWACAPGLWLYSKFRTSALVVIRDSGEAEFTGSTEDVQTPSRWLV